MSDCDAGTLRKIHKLADRLYASAKEDGVSASDARVYRECASAVLAVEVELTSKIGASADGHDVHEVCICAALKFDDGRIVRGHRHDSCFRTAEGWTPKPELRSAEQGFITSRERFVGRREGAALQHAAGRVSAMTGKAIGGILFSEDLYFDTHDRARHDALTIPR